MPSTLNIGMCVGTTQLRPSSHLPPQNPSSHLPPPETGRSKTDLILECYGHHVKPGNETSISEGQAKRGGETESWCHHLSSLVKVYLKLNLHPAFLVTWSNKFLFSFKFVWVRFSALWSIRHQRIKSSVPVYTKWSSEVARYVWLWLCVHSSRCTFCLNYPVGLLSCRNWLDNYQISTLFYFKWYQFWVENIFSLLALFCSFKMCNSMVTINGGAVNSNV